MIYTAVAYEYGQKSVYVMKMMIILLIGYLWTCNASDTSDCISLYILSCTVSVRIG